MATTTTTAARVAALRAERLARPTPRVKPVPLPADGALQHTSDVIGLNTAMAVASDLLEKLATGAPLSSDGRFAEGDDNYFAFATGSLESSLRHLLTAVQARLAVEAQLVEAAAPVASSLRNRITADNAMTPQAVMVRQLHDALLPFGARQ